MFQLDPLKHLGWAGQDAAKRAWNLIGHRFQIFGITGGREGDTSTGKRVVSWDVETKMLGAALPTTYQNIGSCVGHGCNNVCWRLIINQAATDGEEIFMPYLPYAYGASRVQVGEQIHNMNFEDGVDGSLGSLIAEAVRTYGLLRSDADTTLPQPTTVAGQYGQTLNWSAAADGEWALKPGVPANYLALGKTHLVKSTARLNSYAQVRDAITNGYWVTMAHTWAFNMNLTNDKGKSWYSKGRAVGGHQTALIGVDDNAARPGVYNKNSWGADAHGPQLDGPPGGGWIDAATIDKLAADDGNEFFAYSQFDGFPQQNMDFILL